MAKTKLFLTETKLTPDHDDKDDKRRPMLNVVKVQNSVDYTIGQSLRRKEVGYLIQHGLADVTIMPRKDQ